METTWKTTKTTTSMIRFWLRLRFILGIMTKPRFRVGRFGFPTRAIPYLQGAPWETFVPWTRSELVRFRRRTRVCYGGKQAKHPASRYCTNCLCAHRPDRCLSQDTKMEGSDCGIQEYVDRLPTRKRHVS